MKYLLVILAMLVGCGHQESEQHDYRTTDTSPQSQELETLKRTVLALQGTIAMINAFTANDFSDCKATLPPFEQKVCNIAQTAVAEGQLEYFSSLAALSKIFQDQLYGPDCASSTAPGCPIAGSITSDITSIQSQLGSASSSIATINSQISVLQGNVTTLQTSLASVNTRLNSFNGSGQSIEVVVTGIKTDIINLQNRVSAIEAVIASGSVWKTVKICGNIAASGPVFEAQLMSGDRLQMVGYVESGQSSSAQRGNAVIATAGSTGTQYLTTSLNTAACKYKIYDLTTQLKVCWKNDNRSATAAQIDTACNSPSFTSPLATCTCK